LKFDFPGSPNPASRASSARAAGLVFARRIMGTKYDKKPRRRDECLLFAALLLAVAALCTFFAYILNAQAGTPSDGCGRPKSRAAGPKQHHASQARSSTTRRACASRGCARLQPRRRTRRRSG
jgi:hypothetical protein